MNLLTEQTLAHKLISKWSIAYIAAFIIAPIWYFLRIIASHNMDVADIGLFYSILWLIGLLSAYNDLGLTEALQYFLPKYRIEKKYDYYKTIWLLTFVMQLLSWIVIGGALWFGSDWLSIHYFEAPQTAHILKIFSVYFVAINFLQAFSSVYMAFQDVIYDKAVETVRLYGVLLCTILFVVFGTLSVETFSYASLAGLGMALVVSVCLFCIKYFKTFTIGQFVYDKSLIKTQLQYAFWVFLGLNAGTLLGQIDQQIVVVLLWAVDAWYYSNYLSLLSIYGVVIYPLMTLIFPITTELITKKNTEKIVAFIQILYKYFSIFAISITWLFMALGPIIGSTLYGDNFLYSWQLLQYSAPFTILNILIVINFWFLAGMGKVKQRVVILLTALCVNIAINFGSILLLWWWLYGVILATWIGWAVMFGLSLYIINRSYPILYDRWFVLQNLCFISWLSVLLWYVSAYIPRHTPASNLYNFIYLGAIVLVYYCILAGFNYRSIVWLWRQTKALWFIK